MRFYIDIAERGAPRAGGLSRWLGVDKGIAFDVANVNDRIVCLINYKVSSNQIIH